MNKQSTKRQEHNPSGSLHVHSIFHSIQGEGPFVGRPAIFIRLAGCNLSCPACDTDYTRYVEHVDAGEVALRVRRLAMHDSVALVVITGGEPLRQNIAELIKTLNNDGFQIQIETNGTLCIKEHSILGLCTIVCSPKTKKIHPQLLPYIDYYKYVVAKGSTASDGLPTATMGEPGVVARPHKAVLKSHIYIQPLDVGDPKKNKSNRHAALTSCMKHGYTLCLQIHKILGVD